MEGSTTIWTLTKIDGGGQTLILNLNELQNNTTKHQKKTQKRDFLEGRVIYHSQCRGLAGPRPARMVPSLIISRGDDQRQIPGWSPPTTAQSQWATSRLLLAPSKSLEASTCSGSTLTPACSAWISRNFPAKVPP